MHAKNCARRPTTADFSKNYIRNGQVVLAPTIKDNEKKEVWCILTGYERGQRQPWTHSCLWRGQYHKRLRVLGAQVARDQWGAKKKRCNKCTYESKNIGTAQLNKTTLAWKSLTKVITGTKFRLVVQTVNKMKENTRSPQLALTLGNYIKGAANQGNAAGFSLKAMILWRYIMHNGSIVVEQGTPNPKTSSPQQICGNTRFDRLAQLKYWLDENILQKRTGKPHPTPQEWGKFAYLLMVRIILYNKRRSSEVEELKISDFQRIVCHKDSAPQEEIQKTLHIVEQQLANQWPEWWFMLDHVCRRRGRCK